MHLWDTYKTSIFLCHQALSVHIDFAIISAQNPVGHVAHPYFNLCLDSEFEARLNRQKIPHRAVVGCAPDYSFQEKSWVVICDKAEAIIMAEQLRQNAIYWVEQGLLYLVPVLMPQQEECIGHFQQRLVLLS